MPLAQGQKLASYEIISALGAGGMGEVYRARDARLGRDVALKVLPPEVINEPGRLERFDREARTIAALNHPHIVTIYSTEEADGTRFLTMELVDGCTLSDLIVPSGIAVPRFLEIAIPLADALAAAHQKHITHRDLKPGNVMLSNDGRVKVLDFGLARVGGGDIAQHSLAATAAPITHQGMIVGTMPYMSPEQVEGRPLDPRSDLFSLGVIFYELLSGDRPFKGSSSPALMSAILRDTPRSVAERRSDIPDALERLVDRLLEKRPEDRWQTARDVFNELRHIKRVTDSGGGRSASSVRPAPSQNLSIAVLPFTARNNDADAEDLAAGLTDDIAASLARFSLLSVVAAQSTRAYKDSPLDVRQIAERLGARYVIGGNIRKSSRVIRVTAQLVDAGSGAQLWSESYDRDTSADDLFAIQDDLTDHIVATVADQSGVLARSMVKSVRADLPASEQTTRELILRTWELRHNPEAGEHAAIRSAIESRLNTDRDNADLWAELAHLYLDEYILALNELPDSLGRAMIAARRAIEIDPSHERGWGELAGTCFFAKDGPGLFDAADRAIRLNPRNAHNLAWMGNLYTHAGEYERGSKLSERAMAIDPRHGGWFHFGVFNRHFAAGDYAEALRAARRVNMPQLNWNYYAIATAAAHLGLVVEAEQAAARMMAITPQLSDPDTLREFTERWYWRPEMVDALVDGVSQAVSVTRSGATFGSELRSGTKPPSSTSGSTRGSALSIAVLPLVARSSDEESKALAQGLADDIAAGLSRFGHISVRSRSASSADARYSIEGYVRRAGPSIRVGVTVVDKATGANLWAEQYDRTAATAAFDLQDDIASRVVATIGDQTGVLARSMAAAIAEKPIEQWSVAELIVRFHIYTESFRPDEHARLREAFERALEREPRNAEGWGCLAMLYEQEHGFGFNRLPDTLTRHRHAAERAIEIDPRSQQAWIAQATVHGFARDIEGLKAAVERVVSINPLNADQIALAGLFLSLAGEHERSRELVETAIARKPQHPGWYHFPMCNYYVARGDYDAALRENKAVNMPKMLLMHLAAAAISGHLGRATEAKAALEGLRAINPALIETTHARAFWTVWIWSDAILDKLEDGFVKARSLAGLTPPASRASDPATSTEQSIAVLPFADLSETKDQDWFCDGIAEEILNALAPLPGLRVAARASAFSFRGKTDDLSVIADKLNVHTVLEGSVRRAGDRVRITTRLSDARLGRQMWSERFDREMKDIFDVQDEISRAIAERLRMTLGAEARLVQKPTANLDAYQLLLKGRLFLNRRGPAVLTSITYFEQAIALDPNLAGAYAGLGDAQRLLSIYGLMPSEEVMPKARAALERALELDPDHPDALATLANIKHAYEWNFAESQRLTERALAGDPLHVRAMTESAITIATAVADPPPEKWTAIVVARLAQARKLDPLNPWVMAIESVALSLLGRYADAEAPAKLAVATDPNNFTGQWALVVALAALDKGAELEQAAAAANAMSGRHTMILTTLGSFRAAHGDKAGATAVYEELTERGRSAYMSFGALAVAAAAAGRYVEARELLAKAIDVREAYLTFLKLPVWRPVWNDPDCAELLRGMSYFKNLK
jgi:serine/threonine-protein kinase